MVMSSHWLLGAAIGKPAIKKSFDDLLLKFKSEIVRCKLKGQDKLVWYLRYSKLRSLDVAVSHIQDFEANWNQTQSWAPYIHS